MRVTGYRIHQWGGPLRWESFEVAAPQPGEVLIRVDACGIGLTVLNCMRGDLATDTARLPRVPGHEIVGRVAAVGAGVSSPSVGQRVMAYFYLVCGTCEACRSGQDSLCGNLAGWVGVHVDGGYAPYTVLPARNAVPLPESVPAADATAIPDAIATPLHVCKTRARIQPGDRVVVIGAGGGVGIHMVEMAALFGGRVAGLEAGEGKFEAIRRMGGTPVLSRSFDGIDLAAVWGERDADVVIDLLGSRASLAWGLQALALGGRLVVLTTFLDVEVVMNPRDLVLREATILGSRYASRAEIMEAADLVAAGKIHPVVSQVVPPEDIEKVHRAIEGGSLVGRGAVDWNL
ncbi:MAG: NADPH:quinone oxidoreductase [Acidobacteria bacterium]|nr:NADPH:quinone oxidoreductase [Acidobacteriota bacterium]